MPSLWREWTGACGVRGGVVERCVVRCFVGVLVGAGKRGAAGTDTVLSSYPPRPALGVGDKGRAGMEAEVRLAVALGVAFVKAAVKS